VALGFVDAVVVADFDRDGHSDVATSGYRKASVRRGRGHGTLLRRHRIDFGDAAGAMGGAAVADFNRDGWPDLALTESCAYGEDRCGPNGARLPQQDGAPAQPCVVPRITRRPLRAGARDLRDSGCRLGSVRQGYARNVRPGRVILHYMHWRNGSGVLVADAFRLTNHST
jgi:hypothetical protein